MFILIFPAPFGDSQICPFRLRQFLSECSLTPPRRLLETKAIPARANRRRVLAAGRKNNRIRSQSTRASLAPHYKTVRNRAHHSPTTMVTKSAVRAGPSGTPQRARGRPAGKTTTTDSPARKSTAGKTKPTASPRAKKAGKRPSNVQRTFLPFNPKHREKQANKTTQPETQPQRAVAVATSRAP